MAAVRRCSRRVAGGSGGGTLGAASGLPVSLPAPDLSLLPSDPASIPWSRPPASRDNQILLRTLPVQLLTMMAGPCAAYTTTERRARGRGAARVAKAGRL